MALEKNQNSIMDYNNIENSDSAALLPHLESFEKMLKLPVVEAAWHQSQDVYGRVKGKPIYFRIFRYSTKKCKNKIDMVYGLNAVENSLIDVLYIEEKMCPNYTQLPMRKKNTNDHTRTRAKATGTIYSSYMVHDNENTCFVH